MDTRKSNTRLDRLHKEAGWTQGQFARAVNLIGTERGTPTTFGESTVHYWRKGVTPKEKVRPLILEALSRKLGRLVTHSEAGFPASIRTPNSCSTVEELIDLGRQDVERRNLLGASLFSVALSIPEWQDIAGRMDSAQSGAVRRIGMSDVDLVTKMTDRLSKTYDEFGGKHTRPMAALFLVDAVAPYLRTDATEEVRKAMMSAASFLCYLTGWMAVDEGLHGLAQRYYVKGLELAGASNDHMTYCHVLRGISVQAVDLGHGPIAVRLADAAAAASPKTGPRMRAFMSGQQAHSFAVAGDEKSALRSIRETERAMDKAESASQTFGGYDPATLAYHTSQVRYALRDVAGSIESLELHFQLRNPNDTRRSALRFSSILAERQLELGHLEAACSTWNQVLDEYPSIHSGRVDRHVADIGRRLRPYCSNSAAREVYERALRSVRV
ncbi:tetratricopeptide repeat protein [Streptomyces jumonjinensis]|uniref:tetratricopeptide repeat protein n=1 Tax=Streptomyces jumonjinensis TaxID=1945 RepID=UPI003795A7A0